MSMEIEEQKGTYSAFIRYSVRSAIAIAAVLAFMAIFVA